MISSQITHLDLVFWREIERKYKNEKKIIGYSSFSPKKWWDLARKSAPFSYLTIKGAAACKSVRLFWIQFV